MKCIKNKDGEIRRVKEVEADEKVSRYGWSFVPKSEWKLNVRDANKKAVSEEVVAKETTAKDKKAIRRQKLKEKQGVWVN